MRGKRSAWCWGLASLIGACTPFSGYSLSDDAGASMSLPQTAVDASTSGHPKKDAGSGKGGGQMSNPESDAGMNAPLPAADGGGHGNHLPDAGTHDADVLDATADDDDGGHALVHVADCAGLARMSERLVANYVLDNDVSCVGYDDGSGAGFPPVGTATKPFRGTFDGAGHVISNLGISHDADTGLFGVTQGAHIQRVAIEGAALYAGQRCGVLIGRATSHTVVEQVFVSGSVNALGMAGGVVGELQDSRLDDVHANVTVSSNQLRGGLLVGAIERGSELEHSYSNGVVTGQMGALAADELAESTVRTSFYDCSLAGGCADANLRGLRGVELRVPGRFIYIGWDYSSPIWGRPAIAGGPCLIWEKGCQPHVPMGLTMQGTGSASAPYHIQTCAHLQLMAANRNAAYVLDRDIACGSFDVGDGLGFWPIGNAYDPFRGWFDGNGHVITGLRILRPHRNDVGLFGVAAGATLDHVSVLDATILGHSSVGVLVGRSQHTTFGACTVSGRLGAFDTAGSAVGTSQNGTSPPACTSSVLVTSLH